MNKIQLEKANMLSRRISELTNFKENCINSFKQMINYQQGCYGGVVSDEASLIVDNSRTTLIKDIDVLIKQAQEEFEKL